MRMYTKDSLIEELLRIAQRGWIPNARLGNVGGIGNTLEDQLGITENNLPLPNASEWELKTQRIGTSSLITLFHFEPSPRALHFVPSVLLPLYGWKHAEAGGRYPESEMSFRQTISGRRSDRGFCVQTDSVNRKVVISFDSAEVSEVHESWLQSVSERTGLGELSPQPYWGYDDLASKARTKLLNCFFIKAEVKREKGLEFYRYSQIYQCQDFSFDNFLNMLLNGDILVDFDARSGHNHGTKFRLRQNRLEELYRTVITILKN